MLDSELKPANTVASFQTYNRAVHTAPTTEIHKYISALESAFISEFQMYGPMLAFVIKPDSVYGHKPDPSLMK